MLSPATRRSCCSARSSTGRIPTTRSISSPRPRGRCRERPLAPGPARPHISSAQAPVRCRDCSRLPPSEYYAPIVAEIIVKAWPMVPRRLLADIRNSPRYLIELAAVALMYFAVAKLSLSLASIHPSATPIWPPTGLALAAVLLRGYHIWPAIFTGAVLVNFLTAGSIYTSCAIGFGNTMEALIGGWLINRWSDGRHTFDTPMGVAKFTWISLGPTTMTSATVGVATLSLAGYAAAASFWAVWMTWW